MPSPTPRWTRPHAWNSGAAMTTVSRARIGTVSSSGVSESTPLTLPRAAPFGRPVVPDVRITWRPTWRVGVQRHERRGRGRARASSLPRRRGQGAGAGDDVGEHVVVEDRVDALVADDVGELRAGEPGVEVHDVGADLGRGDDAQHERRGRCGRGSRPCCPARRRGARSSRAMPSVAAPQLGVASSGPASSMTRRGERVAGRWRRRCRRPSSGPTRPSPASPGAGGPGRSGRRPARASALAAAARRDGRGPAISPARAEDEVLDARRAHRRPQRLDEVGQHEQVVDLARLAADVLLQQPLGLEAEAARTSPPSPPARRRPRRRAWSCPSRSPRRRPAGPAVDRGPWRRCPGSTTRRISPTCAAPADAADHGDVADDLAVDDRDQPVLLGVGEPALDDAGLQDVLAEERAIALGHACEERPQRIGVRRLERPGPRPRSSWSRRPRSLRSAPRGGPSQSAIAGMLWRWAVRPTMTPTCPAGSRSSSMSVDPTS